MELEWVRFELELVGHRRTQQGLEEIRSCPRQLELVEHHSCLRPEPEVSHNCLEPEPHSCPELERHNPGVPRQREHHRLEGRSGSQRNRPEVRRRHHSSLLLVAIQLRSGQRQHHQPELRRPMICPPLRRGRRGRGCPQRRPLSAGLRPPLVRMPAKKKRMKEINDRTHHDNEDPSCSKLQLQRYA